MARFFWRQSEFDNGGNILKFLSFINIEFEFYKYNMVMKFVEKSS